VSAATDPRYESARDGGRGSVEVRHLPTQWQPSHTRPKLPIGAGLLAIAIAIIGLVLLISGTLFVLNYYDPSLVPTSLLILHSFDPIGASILVILGAILLGLASALWDQERWALYTTIGAVFLLLAYEFFLGSVTFLFLLLLVLFIYLLAVRRHFF
jgi:small-conductance mechanosensitive channel